MVLRTRGSRSIAAYGIAPAPASSLGKVFRARACFMGGGGGRTGIDCTLTTLGRGAGAGTVFNT